MKPSKRYVPRPVGVVTMRELEAGDRPRDREGRRLSFVPGDLLVESPFHIYVLGREVAEALYIEVK